MSEVNAPTTKMPSSAIAVGAVLAVVGIGLTAMGLGGGGVAGLAGPWLYGAMFWSMLTFGCFGLTLLFNATRGRWGTPLLRIFEAGGGPISIGFAAVLLLGITWFVFKEPIYGAWIHMPATDQILQNKKFYLNEVAFPIRSVLILGIWGAVAFFFKKWTRQEELTGEKKFSDWRNNLSGVGLCLFFALMTFLSTDYVMSIDPYWYSTMWGVLFSAGAGLGAMGLGVAIVMSQSDKEPYAGKIDNLMRNDWGNLLLMLTMLWGYFSFSQLLIIWSGNLKELIPFYLSRLIGHYSGLGNALFFGQFLLPFLLLLMPSLKRSKAMLGFVAGMIFLFRIADMYWFVMPYFRDTLSPMITDFGPLCLIGGAWLILFGTNLKKSPMYIAAHPYQEFEGTMELKEATENV